MSAVSDYAVEVNKSFDEIDAALEVASTKFAGIADDVAFQKEVIDKLQNNPGPISEEDQKLLTAGQVRVNGLATKVNGFKDALTKLDEATARPEPPVEPPVPVE